MAVGYEARARITADVSGFVSAQRQAAQAAGTLVASMRQLNRELRTTQQLAQQSASALRPFAQHAEHSAVANRNAAQSARQGTTAMQSMASAYTQGAMAAQRNAEQQRRNTQTTNQAAQVTRAADQVQRSSIQTLRSMAREMQTLGQQRRNLMQVERQNGQLTAQQNQALLITRQRLRELGQANARLTAEQRALVGVERQLLQARQTNRTMLSSMNRFAREQTQATQQQTQAQRAATQQQQLSTQQLRMMGNEMARVAHQIRNLEQAQRASGNATQQQNQALGMLRARAGELNAQLRTLTANQQQTVRSFRDMGAASREASSALNSTRTAADQLDGSLFAMRSAVGDIEGMFRTLYTTSLRMVTSLWENFSAQEMGVAHLSRVTQATVFEVNAMESAIRSLTESIPLPFEDLANIGVLGAQVNVANENLAHFTETVALFAATTDVAEDQAALMFARIMEMSGISDREIRNLAAAVSELGSNSAATEREILTTIESIVTVGTAAGLSVEGVVGLGSAMAALRIRPELARGAVQRVFLQLGNAVEGAGAEMEVLSDVTGLTGEELALLQQQDTDQFFMRVMEGLGGAADSGEQLIPILRQIGINNTRDADAVARLAQNYDLLSTQMDLAGESYARGTYLQQEANRIFTTITARVQILANEWQNFLFGVVSALGPFITAVIDAASNVLRFASAMNAEPLIAWGVAATAVIGALSLMGAAIAAATRTKLALQAVTMLMAQANATEATSATAAAGALTAKTGATAAASAASTAGAASATAHAGSLSAMGLAATGARAAMAALAATLRALPWVAVAFAATGAAAAIWDNVRSAEASQKANIDAAGGLDTLREALINDTQAWRDSKYALDEQLSSLSGSNQMMAEARQRAQESIESTYHRLDAVEEMSAADRRAAEAAQDFADNQAHFSGQVDNARVTLEEQGRSFGRLAERYRETGDLTGAMEERYEGMSGASDEATGSIEGQTIAVGAATEAWALASMEAALLESGLLQTSEGFEILEASGVNFAQSLALELQHPGEGVRELEADFWNLYHSMGPLERTWGNITQALHDMTFGFIDLRSETVIAAQTVWDMKENLEATSGSIAEARKANEALEQGMVELANGAQYTREEMIDLDEATEMMESTFTNTSIAVDDVAQAFADFRDPLDDWKRAQEEANEAAQAADDTFQGMANVTLKDWVGAMQESREAQEEWASNLMTIAAEVPPEVTAAMMEMGIEGVDAVAAMVDAIARGDNALIDQMVDEFTAAGDDINSEWGAALSTFVMQASAAGDDAGLEFASNIMERYHAGDIDLREAINELTDYAETEFADADPVLQGQMENTQALRELANVMLEVDQSFRLMNEQSEVTSRVDNSGAYSAISALASYIARNPITQWVITRFSGNSAPQRGSGGSDGPRRTTGFSSGGWVSGDGGPRADKIPAMLSDGEFVVNARASREFAPLLNWINSGGELGAAGRSVMSPNFVPDNVMNAPSVPLPSLKSMMPADIAGAMRTGSQAAGPRIVVNVNNHYPQAEPTSVTTNRALQYAAALDGLS